ncbi:MAG: type I DNA topoisomerase [Candidatus Izemoplasma sp.]|nr:type I DNA topoisomerase [Candidatus Izemoplasma sp.]
MAEKLVIVESPSKSKTISQYLGDDYHVLSSKGHIRDLAIKGKGGLGLEIENDFKPQYSVIKNKNKIVKELKKAAKKADEIYLATDPDREGEAISWHLKETLNTKDKPTKRVIFNEITRDRVKEAFDHPRDIDYDLVSSQETRRILDRIIGFKLSKLLQNKIKSKSAGRVQSAALKMIVEREKEIEAFVPDEYWKIKAIFPNFEAELDKINGEKAELTNEKETMDVVNDLDDQFTIDKIDTRNRKRQSKLPFTTSAMQQEASTKLNFSSAKTMLIAQRLYEGIELGDETVGLITYMRTDSTRMSDTFIQPALSHIEKTHGKEYRGVYKKPKNGSNTQDAHEAIRPTSVEYTPKEVKPYLKRDEYKLYRLIYLRAIASLMKAATLESTSLLLKNKVYLFKSTAQKLVFDGYLRVYDYETVTDQKLPDFTEGESVKHDEIEPTQHFTSPPARFSEAKLIKEMEEVGIGRPSTYSQTISTLKKRKYVTMKSKAFMPTDQGRLTIEKLDEFFAQIISVDYTARMEKVLDEISMGNEDQTKIISSFYHSFIPMVENANKHMEKIAPKFTGETCPKCGHKMVYRQSKYGTFEACSNFPECKYIKQNKEQEKVEPESTGVTCAKCQTGTIVKRVAKSGRNKGNTFYACDNFPKCRNILQYEPTGETCPECGKLLMKDEDGIVMCQDQKQCGYKK